MLNQEDPPASTTRNRLALAVALALRLLWGSNYSVQKAVMAEIGAGCLGLYALPRHAGVRQCPAALAIWVGALVPAGSA